MSRFTTLYSGSSGNCAVVASGHRFLLVDMGKNCKTTLQGLDDAGLSPMHLQGILVTHEHIDHVRGLRVFLKRWPVPVYATGPTLRMLLEGDMLPDGTEVVPLNGAPALVGDFSVQGFEASHDAAGCCGYRIQTPDGACMAIATDLGQMTPQVMEALRGAALVALEANYDPASLRNGPYPAYLKRRIASPLGHLSNYDSARAVGQLLAEGCSRVALCHLSAENNTPSLALQAMQAALAQYALPSEWLELIQVSRRHSVSPWIEFGETFEGEIACSTSN